MILSVELEYFLQHINRSFVFKDELNTIRGRNEEGKSSLILAILYALWGTKVLPLSLEETVSWGHPVSKLKVTMTMMVDGNLLIFKRGPNGAECQHSGGTVTGQAPVSAFASQLLGATSDKAFKLMVASQNSLRGALEEGAVKVASYIEEFSGMELFDVLLEEAGEQLQTGPTKIIDSRIEEAEEELKKPAPEAPDLKAMEQEISDNTQQIDALKVVLEREALPRMTEAEDAHNQAVASEEIRVKAEDAYLRANNTYQSNRHTLHAIRNDMALPDQSLRVKQIEESLGDATKAARAKEAKTEFDKLPNFPQQWEGSFDSLVERLAHLTTEGNRLHKLGEELKFKIKENNAHKVNSANCSYCGQDFSAFPEVKAKNEDIDKQNAEWTVLINEYAVARKAVVEEANTLTAIRDAQHKVSNFLGKHGEFVTTDDSVVPTAMKFIPVIMNTTTPEELRRELIRLKESEKKRTEAEGKIGVMEKMIIEEEVNVSAMGKALPKPQDVNTLKKMMEAARTRVQTIREDICRKEAAILHTEQRKSRLLYDYEMKKRHRQEQVELLDKLKEERRQLIFNNNLVKKIKAARPIVASKLWSVVLASVSTMFSNMRGETSIVERREDGFTVNGKSIKGLSGSAQDILGMALRVALLKSFVPHCPFMILDEPMHACDEQRTNAMLEFINSVNFEQVLLVTHESLSADWANHNVML